MEEQPAAMETPAPIQNFNETLENSEEQGMR